MPSAPKNPSQNWCVVQTLRTFGMPILCLLRASSFIRRSAAGSPEGLRSNHLANIGMDTPTLLHFGFHHLHLVDILQQSLGAGIAANDAFPAFLEGNLAPRSALAARNQDIDECPFAIDGTPPADRVETGRAAVFEPLDPVEADEAAWTSGIGGVKRAQRSADVAGLAAVGMDQDFGIRHLAGDEVDLRFDHGKIAVRPALQHETATRGA